MIILLNTDRHIAGSDALTSDVERKMTSTLKRFSGQITRVEVHLSDLNSSKTGPEDKRCVVEARAAGLPPISVSHQAPTVPQAIDGAREKIASALDAAFGKREAARHDKVVPAVEDEAESD